LLIRAQSYAGLGQLYCLNNDLDRALDSFKHALKITYASQSPLPAILFALTGVASIYAKQQKYTEAIELLTLILRYPPNFIAMIEDKSVALLDELTERVGKKLIESTMIQSKSLILKNVIADLIAD
jgi:tetratricopeptide (TPR) repeat protein